MRQISADITLALVGDIDNNAVDQNYYLVKKNKGAHIIPFTIDLLNPSPAIGFQNTERFSFIKRVANFQPDVTLALALIHHLSLTGNVPFENSAQFFASISNNLLIEFPKRTDSYVQRLLNAKAEFKNHFEHYQIENFEKAIQVTASDGSIDTNEVPIVFYDLRFGNRWQWFGSLYRG